MQHKIFGLKVLVVTFGPGSDLEVNVLAIEDGREVGYIPPEGVLP
jgi:hypothetical protein